MGEDAKAHKLRHVQTYLVSATSFLQNYLPLANAHATDFIINRHWTEFIPGDICSELLGLTEQELISLPSINLPSKLFDSKGATDTKPLAKIVPSKDPEVRTYSNFESKTNDKIDQNDESNIIIEKPESKSDENKECSTMENKFSNENFPRRISPTWMHPDLSSFLQDAKRHTLPCSGLVLSLDDYRERHLLSESENQTDITPKDFMNLKKHHEIGVMGSLCSSLAHKKDIYVVS